MSHLRLCCVPCCKNEKFSLVHKFPSDNERAERWRRALAIDNFIGLPIEVIRKRYYVCSRHFRDSDYKNKASRSINTTAVPSINLFALNEPEGLCRKIPSPVRPTMVAYLQERSTGTVEQDQEEVSVVLDEQVLEEEQDEPTIEFIKMEEVTIPHTVQEQNDKTSSITYELNNFIEDSFTSDPTITLATMTKNTLLAPSPTVASEAESHITVVSSNSLASKRTLLKRPNSSAVVVSQPVPMVSQGGQPAPSFAKQGRFAARLPQPSLSVPISDTVVLKRVKMAPYAKDRKEKSTNCAMTQTDDLRSPLDKAPIDEESQAATGPTTSTKVLALLECTPENLERLQRKLADQGGAMCLDERLLRLDDDETDSEEDKAMAPSKADDRSRFLTIRNAQTQETASVSYVWLRDHCRCAECYNASTFQRSYTILDLPVDIEPASCNINNEWIGITWKDGHESTYNLNDIFENQLDTFRKRLDERRSQLVLWDRALITDSSATSNGADNPSGYARVTLNELLCEDDVMRRVVASLVTYGFAFITKVPPNQQSTEIAVKRIFPIQRTLFGEMWTFSDDKMDHSDTSYTNGYLGPHTDNTYFCDAAGLQVLHCIQFNGTGAETILIDGFNATERLRMADPGAFERLCSYPLEAEYIEEDKHHRYVAPVIRRHPCAPADGSLVEQIRFNLYDRAPLRTLPPETVPQFYSDYQRLAREISNEELQWKFQLAPGTVLIFDNWRVLHGRMAYSGKRVMTGCYVARTEYQSVARTMGLIE
uniref:Trimethyllysine dioxygenase, mitochondrial n=1 Tax=Anopheles atroparvus TaxID=41427 RepID=A0AAG5DFJ6_ANOAO